MKRTKELKEIVIGAKLPASLVLLLDEEAAAEGTSRSHIIRRSIIERYRDRAHKGLVAGKPDPVAV